MRRAGPEPKPPWHRVPLPVRHVVSQSLGAEVRRAQIAWGGYTPTPTYRLLLTDRRRAFFKAVSSDSNDFARAAHQREERVYRELGHLIGPWAPAFYGAFACEDWQVLLLEDLGAKSAPPWTPALTRRVARAYGDFHAATLGQPIPSWVPRTAGQGRPPWEWVTEPDARLRVRGLVDADAEVAAGLRWLETAAPTLVQAARALRTVGPPEALLHRDTRSDNLRWTPQGLRLVDWPHVGVGPPEDDVAAFAQSVTTEGGPPPEQIMDWYAERVPVRPVALDAAVADLAGFFADEAWRPAIPGLPRLRVFQRAQLGVTLAWAARRLDLPPPTWLNPHLLGQPRR